MLILTRKNGESIKIGDEIEITILSVKNDQVKIGFKAPRNVEILRKEIYEETLAENEQASKEVKGLLNLLNKQK